jgi:hypothetical protein
MSYQRDFTKGHPECSSRCPRAPAELRLRTELALPNGAPACYLGK